MNRRLSPCLIFSLLAGGLGCGDSQEATVDPAADRSKVSIEQQNPSPPPLPKPLMRKAMHCCKNLKMELVIQAYLALGVALADKDAEAITAMRDALVEALPAANLDQEQLAPLQSAIAAINAAEVRSSRESYGVVSEILMRTIEPSQAGKLDLAVAYSRQADAHWLQEGVEPKSPYGDGINSYSWGNRTEVQEADKTREKERGDRP